MRPFPLSVLARTSEWLAEALHADRGFAGVLVGNPTHEDYETVWLRTKPYRLDELRAFIPQRWRRPKGIARTDAGRNCDVFRALMRFAGNANRSDDDVVRHANALCARLDVVRPHPFTISEVAGIVRSVLRYREEWRSQGWHKPGWLAQRADAGRGNTSDEQRAKGQIGGVRSGEARRRRTTDRDRRILEHNDNGLSIRQIATLEGVSRNSVHNVVARLDAGCPTKQRHKVDLFGHLS